MSESHADEKPQSQNEAQADPNAALLAHWIAARERKGIPAERVSLRIERAVGAVLAAAKGDVRLAEGAIDAFLASTDSYAKDAGWSALLIQYRIPGLLLAAQEAAAEAERARIRAVKAAASAKEADSDPPSDPARARAMLDAIRRNLAAPGG